MGAVASLAAHRALKAAERAFAGADQTAKIYPGPVSYQLREMARRALLRARAIKLDALV